MDGLVFKNAVLYVMSGTGNNYRLGCWMGEIAGWQFSKETGEIYFRSDCWEDEESEITEETYDPEGCMETPHKNELDLGRNLVFEFVEDISLGIEPKITLLKCRTPELV